MPATSASALHDRNFYTWTRETARAIRERSFDAVDWESVAEELEDMGRSEQRELESRLSVLLAHLLKWRYRPEPAANKGWALMIEEQRQRTRRILKQSPGLKRMLEETFAEAYGDARLQAARDCGVDKNAFPDTCPWAFDRTMNDGFWPGR
jgi:hypothetical protein